MHPITTAHYLALSAALLIIGTVGVLTRRNVVIILMSIELILNALFRNKETVLADEMDLLKW